MKLLLTRYLLLFLCASCWSLPHNLTLNEAKLCQDSECEITENCRCASINTPLTAGVAPQLVVLTFSDPVQDITYTRYLNPLLSGRKNPDGNPIGGTFYVSHEYSDYKRVHDLYVKGFEIAVDSISNNNLQEYWRKADLETLKEEFGGQKTILETFAKIPVGHIVGARTPQLQLNGDVSIQAYVESGFEYDNSWPSRSTDLLFPYTLDYASIQECTDGHPCPEDSHPGFWMAPILNLQSHNGSLECNFLSNCLEEGTAEHIRDWLLSQLSRVKTANRSPLSILVVPAWFSIAENHWEGFNQFLDALVDQEDVFLVSQKEVVNWVKNPVPLSQFQTAVEDRKNNCPSPVSCELLKPDGTVRYMMSCVPCPYQYPWLGDPLGNGEV